MDDLRVERLTLGERRLRLGRTRDRPELSRLSPSFWAYRDRSSPPNLPKSISFCTSSNTEIMATSFVGTKLQAARVQAPRTQRAVAAQASIASFEKELIATAVSIEEEDRALVEKERTR